MINLLTYLANDTLSVVKEIIPPPPVSFSFNTPGWHVVEGLLLFVAIVMTAYLLDKWYKNAYRREALKAMNATQGLAPADIRKISTLLKQTAMTAYGSTPTGSLTGEAWYDFLKSKVKKCPLPKEKFLSVMQYSYTVDETKNINDLNENTIHEFVEFSTYWVRRHEA